MMLRARWSPGGFYQRTGAGKGPEPKSFLIEVCEDHKISDDAEMRMRGLTTCIATIMFGSTIFALMFAGSDVWAGQPIAGWVYPYMIFLALTVFFGYIAFRPNPVEAAVKIVGFDFEMQHVWLQVKRQDYLDALMKENEISTELVNWVVKA
jgi:hypothetical protein